MALAPVAALFVESGGAYHELQGVDPWDEARDARRYRGPHPVVAHPPCGRWCRLAGLVEARWGHRKGEDGGCFRAALRAVRRYGGVLEHPAYTDAWAAFGLPRPHRAGGWLRTPCGGWVCHVEQGNYGHPARKATWLYAVRVMPGRLLWGPAPPGRAIVGWCANRIREDEARPRIDRQTAARTPDSFRDVLLALARSVR